MDNNNATEKCNTNLESSEPGLQDRLYLKLLGPTLESKKRHRICYYVFYPPTLYKLFIIRVSGDRAWEKQQERTSLNSLNIGWILPRFSVVGTIALFFNYQWLSSLFFAFFIIISWKIKVPLIYLSRNQLTVNINILLALARVCEVTGQGRRRRWWLDINNR